MSISRAALEIWWENFCVCENFTQLCFCLAWSMLVLYLKSPFLTSQWVIDHMAPTSSLAAKEEGEKKKNNNLDNMWTILSMRLTQLIPPAVSRELAHWISFIKAKGAPLLIYVCTGFFCGVKNQIQIIYHLVMSQSIVLPWFVMLEEDSSASRESMLLCLTLSNNFPET